MINGSLLLTSLREACKNNSRSRVETISWVPVLIDTGLVKLWPVVSGDGNDADMIWNNSVTLKSKEEEVDCFSGATPTVIGSRAGVEAGENTSFFLDAMAAYVSKVGSN